jgi:hypothetical protein
MRWKVVFSWCSMRTARMMPSGRCCCCCSSRTNRKGSQRR